MSSSSTPPTEGTLSPGALQAGRQVFVPPLIIALTTLMRLRGEPRSVSQLTGHLPGGFIPPTVEECLRAAELAGARPRVLALPALPDIPTATLPCILLLEATAPGRTKTCVLLSYNREQNLAEVIYPENAPEVSTVALDELESSYSGMSIFLAHTEGRKDARVESLHLSKPRHWFWGVLGEFLPIYRDVAIASLVVNLLSLATPLFIMNVYDRVVPNNAVYTLWVLALGVMIAYCMDLVLRNLRNYFVDTAGRNADVIITSRLMDRILHMRLDVKPESTGGLVNNLREVEQVRDFFGSSTLMALFDLPFLLIFIMLVAFIGGPMVLVVLLALPAMLAFVWLLQRPFEKAVERQFKQNMQKNSLLVEIVSGLETVKSILAQGHMKRQWEQVVDAAAKDATRARRLSSLAQTGTLFMTQLINASVIIIGVYRITAGEMTQGGLIACVILVGRALGPFMQIAGILSQLQRSRIALRALEQIVNLPVEQDSSTSSESGSVDAEIIVTHLTFRYPNSPKNALRDLGLRIRPGEKIAFMGPPGSGKSTLARLLVGLYQPQDGNITLGGVDIRQMDQADLRARIGFMPQDNYLFYGSVRENIALGCPWVDMKSVAAAAHIAGVDEFVNRHPAGYDMPVGERGMALSGGQRQAVALARTLVRMPEIFVLDEPSSNMDMEGEHRLMLRLKSLARHKTLLIMTHRPSLLALAERVVLLREGVIVADGPRDAVLQAIKSGQTGQRNG
ncbi:type I secretion system permease/ATPase [Desulfovibrio sp. OttesenSCG-928-M14]|nr:type I secretion system permease/ATPase [Desulfovibrio sp. OttesenSCG-928-M14]